MTITREEKIALLIDELEDIRCDNFDANTDEDKTLKEAVRVIKALEQEPVLDKIRAEIEEYKSRQLTLAIGVADLEEGKQIAIEYVLAIIAKYKAESEDVVDGHGK